jgi:hypothetical protein
MSNLFDDLEEDVLRTTDHSSKESFADMGLDEEERDKIINSVSGTINVSDLNVDYSDFANHIFFGSAYAASNFALSRIIRDYPTDGELKEKNEWRRRNTGYENWFFDNFPKRQGYLQATSGTAAVSGSWATVADYEGKLALNSGTLLSSFTVESIVRIDPNFDGSQPIVVARNDNGLESVYFYLRKESGLKNLVLNLVNINLLDVNEITASFDGYVSQSNHIAATYNNTTKQAKLFVNGEVVGSSTFVGASTGVLDIRHVDVGFYDGTAAGSGKLYSTASIDDVRIWNQQRPDTLIKRNYYRTIHANHSGGLKLYWKFNEPVEYGNKIIDYSGNALHGYLTGNWSLSQNIQSGTLGGWFKDAGDPVLALANSSSNAFIETQRNSGSLFDDENPSMIFNLVPAKFVEDEDTEYQQLFLLLTARHFDRLKLYIQHLSNISKISSGKYNGPPSNLLDLTAQHYGFDIGGIFAGADPLQYFFGEEVYASGSLDSSIEHIKNTIKRNVLRNLTYILKSKSTQESIKSTLRAVGLNDNVVTISEYTDFSGGVQTTFTPKTVERRIAHFTTSSNIHASSSSGMGISDTNHLWQVRVLFNTGSSYLTQSLFSMTSGTADEFMYNVSAIRENTTSSYAHLRFTSLTTESTSSLLPIWSKNWNNFSFHYLPMSSRVDYFVSSMDRTGLSFTHSSSAVARPVLTTEPHWVVLGTSGSTYFDGHMHEFRKWSDPASTWNELIPRLNRWGLDWELLELTNPLNDYEKLKCHLKLDDFTGSVDGGGPIHDYVHGLSGSSYVGFSSSAEFNFPGKYIDKFDISHTYDLNVDNDKIRIRSGSDFTENDYNYDIPFVSIDFSPITALNKEIMKWFGSLEKIVQITNDPIYQYRNTNAHLDALRSSFFRNRVNDKIDYAAFVNLIRWFDSNFTYLLSQLIPLDMGYSISNYVIEPHILEYNKVKKFASIGSAGKTNNLEATITVSPTVTADGTGNNLGLADPGRYGAFVSASAEVTEDVYLRYNSSSAGINYENYFARKVVDAVLRDDIEKNAPDGYGNGFYVETITGSDYLKNTLNVNSEFAVSGIYYAGAGNLNTNFLSSSHGRPSTPWTGSFNGYQDARWLWMGPVSGSPETLDLLNYTTNYMINFGIGYGGMWGQLVRSNKSFRGYPLRPASLSDMPSQYIGGVEGPTAYGLKLPIFRRDVIEYFNEDDLKTVIFWPTLNSFDGVEVGGNAPTLKFTDGTTAVGLGEVINIEGYDTVNIEILGRTNPMIVGADFIVNVEMKFQFFSTDTPGDFGYETALSASRANATSDYSLTNIPVVYNLTTETLPSAKPVSFQLSMERSLPKQRYMRVWVKPTLETVSSQGGLKLLFKAVLSNKQRTVDELPIRDV